MPRVVVVDQAQHVFTHEVHDHGRGQRVQLPTIGGAEDAHIAGKAAVGFLGEVRRRIVRAHLIERQRDATHVDRRTGIALDPVDDVAGHVDAVRIVIAKVEDDRETLAAVMQERLRGVADVGEVRHPQFVADAR